MESNFFAPSGAQHSDRTGRAAHEFPTTDDLALGWSELMQSLHPAQCAKDVFHNRDILEPKIILAPTSYATSLFQVPIG